MAVVEEESCTLTLTISVVVVTYNGWQLLRDCLRSLEMQTRLPDEIIVVDNGSTDATMSRLAVEFPHARTIDAGCNRGFATGNNLGIAASGGDIVVLLNNDTVAERDFLHELTRPLESSATLGSVAATMVFAANPAVIASAGIDMHANGLALDRNLGLPRAASATPARVFGASAGAAAYRREALDDVGWFPDAFFMYLEDVDLAWRLRLRGWDSLHAPRAVVRHAYSASSIEGSTFKRRILARNRLWVMVRCLPWWFLRRFGNQIARYEAMVAGYSIVTRDWPALAGRREGIVGLRPRYGERERIQSRARATFSDIVPLVRPSPSPAEVMRLRRVAASFAVRP